MISRIDKYPFCQTFLKHLLSKSSLSSLEELRERLTAELKVAEALLSDETYLDLEYEILVKLRLKYLRQIHSNRTQLLIILVLRLVVICLGEDFRFLFEMYLDEVSRKQLAIRTAQYSYYTELSDELFLGSLEEELSNQETRLQLIRELNSKNFINQDFSLIERIFEEALSLKSKKSYRPEPRRLIRHKGYRDHGSLRQSKITPLDSKRKPILTYEEENLRESQSELENYLSFYENIEFLPI